MSNRGLFITLEGVEGAGKSTQLAFIRDYLVNAGVDLVLTREPGGTELGEEIREILLKPREAGMHALTELMLIFAARTEHIEQKITHSLNQGYWVLCDRFTDATYAYQGGGRGLSMGTIELLENLVQGDLRPDATIYLDLPVEVGLKRASDRGQLDRFEQEKADFFHRVREMYLKRSRQHPDTYHVINANTGVKSVSGQIRQLLDRLMRAAL